MISLEYAIYAWIVAGVLGAIWKIRDIRFHEKWGTKKKPTGHWRSRK